MSGKYSKEEKGALYKSLAISIVASLIVIALIVFAPSIKRGINNWKYNVQKADDATDYKTLKEVEDTCRAYIASYEADKITYDTNKMLDSITAVQTAEAAKTRANRTAATYNSYYLKNI